MVRLLIPLAVIAALVLVVSPAAREYARRHVVSVLAYGGAAVALLLASTGRINPVIAAGWALLALVRAVLPRLWQRLRRLRHRPQSNAEDTGGEAEDGGDGKQALERGAMTAREARETLGVDAEAGPDAIAAAHRRLMQRAHPDRGGSPDLARRLNEARAVLLGDKGGDHGA